MAERTDEQCRTCLATNCNMVSLAADHVVCFKVMPVLSLLKTCTSVEIDINDEFPQFVCLECIRKVEKSYEFRMQCDEADKSLRSQSEETDDKLTMKMMTIEKEEFESVDIKPVVSNSFIDATVEELDESYEGYEVLEEDSVDNENITKEEKNYDIEELNLAMLQNNASVIKCEEIEMIDAYSCTTCELIFPTSNALMRHSTSSHSPNFYKCPHCHVRFISEHLLNRHIVKHDSNKSDEEKPTRKYVKQKNKAVSYTCNVCGKKFMSLHTLTLHSRKHSFSVTNSYSVNSFICNECDHQFVTADDLNMHIERMHCNKKTPTASLKLHCSFCFKVLRDQEELQKHESTHTKQDEDVPTEIPALHKMVYKCKECMHEVKLLTEIKDHLIKMHNISTQNLFKNLLYSCSECETDYNTIYEYFGHTTGRSGTKDSSGEKVAVRKKRPYICNINDCGKAFPSPSALKNHSRSHESCWPKKCKYCDTIVNKLHEYIQHLNKNHEGLKKFECKICRKRFFSDRNLKTHSGIHTGERNYMCDYCGFSFHAHNNLVSHRRIHEGVKPYKCTYCPMAFSQHAGLRSHLINHTQEKKYECSICKRKFLRNSAMKNHMKTHTGQKDYMCHVCGARFGASSSRKKHLLTHTGERNHVCNYCGKAFGRKSNLNVHLKIHTGETPHVCEICGKGFIQKHVLRSHMETHKKHGGGQILSRRAANRKHKQQAIDKLNNLRDSETEELTVLVEFPE